jgi:hypothetical protein
MVNDEVGVWMSNIGGGNEDAINVNRLRGCWMCCGAGCVLYRVVGVMRLTRCTEDATFIPPNVSTRYKILQLGRRCFTLACSLALAGGSASYTHRVRYELSAVGMM